MKKLNKILDVRLFANIIICIISVIITIQLDNIDNTALFFLSIATLAILSVVSLNLIDSWAYKKAKKECKLVTKYCDAWPTEARIELEERENGGV